MVGLGPVIVSLLGARELVAILLKRKQADSITLLCLIPFASFFGAYLTLTVFTAHSVSDISLALISSSWAVAFIVCIIYVLIIMRTKSFRTWWRNRRPQPVSVLHFVRLISIVAALSMFFIGFTLFMPSRAEYASKCSAGACMASLVILGDVSQPIILLSFITLFWVLASLLLSGTAFAVIAHVAS